MNTLWALRIYGPTTAADLAERMGRSRWRVKVTLFRLVAAGFASCQGGRLFDVTQQGRDALAGQLAKKRRHAAALLDRATDEDRWQC